MAVGSAKRSGLIGATFVVALLLRAPAASATCQFNCTGSQCSCSDSGTCDVHSKQIVSPGAVIDCPGTDITLGGNNGGIEVTDGMFTLRARNLTVNSQHTIDAERNTGTADIGMLIQLTGNLTVDGGINANADDGGGTVTVEADGDIMISSGGAYGIKANGVQTDSPGGAVRLVSKGNVTIADAVLVNASDTGTADGGSVEVAADGNVTVGATVSAAGRKAQAGTIALSADGMIAVNASLLVEGWGLNGDGGEIRLQGKGVNIGNALSAQGGRGYTGGESRGGGVVIEAGDSGIAINASINVTSGEQGSGVDGGAIVANSEGAITVASGVQLLTRSESNGGDGGDVVLAADGNLTLGQVTIDARGYSASGNHGAGASLKLSGCAVSIAASASINASGYNGGTVAIIAREMLSIGSLASIVATGSGGDQGAIEIDYRADGKCEADPTLACFLSQCTSGKCTHDLRVACAADIDCTGCPTGTCVAANPSIASNATLNPAPESTQKHNLGACR